MKLLVTGANGQLGLTFKAIQEQYDHEFIFVTRNDIDLSGPNTIKEKLQEIDFDVLINCAAYTAVDKAEEEEELANTVNGDSVGEMSKYCADQDKLMIHISTDFVFNGKAYEPLTEDHETEPVSIYGSSKLLGENAVQENAKRFYIIRTAWVYSPYQKNFVKTMMRFMGEKDQLGIVYDQVGSPTYTFDLAEAIMKMIEFNEQEDVYGVYHYSNEGAISWYDFSMAIKDLGGFNLEVKSIRTHEYPLPAKRPNYSVLDKKKIKETFALKVPYWKDSLVKCMKHLNN